MVLKAVLAAVKLQTTKHGHGKPDTDTDMLTSVIILKKINNLNVSTSVGFGRTHLFSRGVGATEVANLILQ